MITIRPGSHVHRLLILLSYVGEIPMSSAAILGSEKTWRALIQKLSSPQEFRFPDSKERITCRMLSVSGRGKLKTIRLYRAALPILQQMDRDAHNYYMRAFNHHHFSGESRQIERHHRVAEAIMMFDSAKVETRPFKLPILQNQAIRMTVPPYPSFYSSRELKGVGDGEENKTRFSTVVGTVFYPGGCHAVFNTRKEGMKWNGRGEGKVLDNLCQIARWNSDADDVNSAILLGSDYQTALVTLKNVHANKKRDLRFDAIYDHIHYVPINEDGRKMLTILTSLDWHENLMDLLFYPEDRPTTPGSIEYDAKVGGVYVLSHLDGDIARLMRFREALKGFNFPVEVLCYPFQTAFLREYLGTNIPLRTVEINSILRELTSERGDSG